MNLRLQFYADKPGEYTNKLFSFKVKDEEAANRLVIMFISNGNNIRAAFLQEYTYVNDKISVIRSPQFDKELLREYHQLYR